MKKDEEPEEETSIFLIGCVSFLLSIYTGTEGLYRQYIRASNLLHSRRAFQTLADTGEFRSPFR